MKLLLAAILLAPAVPALAQFNQPNSDNSGEMTAASGQNSIYSVANRFNGTSLIEIMRLAPNGTGALWRTYYNPGYDAFATTSAGDRDGDLFVVGTARQQGAPRQVLVVKYGANMGGGLSWDYVFPTQSNAVPIVAATDAQDNLSVATNVSDGQGGTVVQVVRIGANKEFAVASPPFNQGRANYAQSLTVDPNGNSEVVIQAYYGGQNSGAFQTYRVYFPANGGGLQILQQL